MYMYLCVHVFLGTLSVLYMDACEHLLGHLGHARGQAMGPLRPGRPSSLRRPALCQTAPALKEGV